MFAIPRKSAVCSVSAKVWQNSHKLSEEEEWHCIANQPAIVDCILQKVMTTNCMLCADLKQRQGTAPYSVGQPDKVHAQRNAYDYDVAPKTPINLKKYRISYQTIGSKIPSIRRLSVIWYLRKHWLIFLLQNVKLFAQRIRFFLLYFIHIQ